MKTHKFQLEEFTPKELEPALRHIENHWQQLEKFEPRDNDTLIGLPEPYVIPSKAQEGGFAFEEMYYWDSYFTAIGLLGTSKQHLAFGMLDNLVYLIKRFGMVPNGGRFYQTGHSQPPFLTSYIMDLYAVKQNKKWLASKMAVAKKEYARVWMGKAHPNWRRVYEGLSRYYDFNVIHDLAEAESGWDMTTRFNRECLNYLPICLNSLLFRYEKDFERTADILVEPVEARIWSEAAEQRRRMTDRYLWNEEKGFYFDYNYVKGEQSQIWSLAGFYPMWAGMATLEQAQRMVANLDKFERFGGLAATADKPSPRTKIPTQWSHPNGWAPLHLIVAYGLEAYGYNIEAQRIVRKWLRTNLTQFNNHGVFFEKYNVVKPDKPPKEGVYPSQSGFGWTNAIFYRLCTDFLQPHELPRLKLPRNQIGTDLVSGAERQLRRFKVRLLSTLPAKKPKE